MQQLNSKYLLCKRMYIILNEIDILINTLLNILYKIEITVNL